MNDLGQPIGFAVAGWQPRPLPPRTPLVGRHCRIEPLDAGRHGADLFAAYQADTDGRIWTYMAYGPHVDYAAFERWMNGAAAGSDPLFHAILDQTSGRALGVAAYLRMEPAVGTIEVGHINYAPALQSTTAATEAMYLMMARVFDELGYRRYEWKCDALNQPSIAAARRLGFNYEGTFRQATLYKGRNRDTAWFSVIDTQWPTIKAAFEAWLAPGNFDAAGRQRRSLSDMRSKASL